MTVAEYARHRKCDVMAVKKAVNTGRIKKTPSGRINSRTADIAWSENTDELRGHRNYAAAATPAQPASDGASEPMSAGATYVAARAEREKYQALLAKLKYEEESGLLVPVKEFEEALASIISNSRSKVLSLPSKIKGRVPHLTTKDVAAIDVLVRGALEDLAETMDAPRREKPKRGPKPKDDEA